MRIKCSKCKKHLPVSEFRIKGRKSDGQAKYQSFCNLCNKEYNKEHYLKNKEKYLQKAKIYDEINKEKITKYIVDYLLLNPCIDCGESDPIVLEFDHRENKRYSISNMMTSGSYPLQTVIEEIKKCDVRCANCHRRRTAKDRKYNILKYVPVV